MHKKVTAVFLAVILVFALVPSVSVHAVYSIDAAVGATHATYLALKTDGSLWSWGLANSADSMEPKKVIDGVQSFSAGADYCMAVKTDGSLWAWGNNNFGKLGDGSADKADSPKKIMDGVKTVSAGESHTLALKTDGSVWGWGYNGTGALANGEKNNGSSVPVKMADGAVSVSAGNGFSLIVKADGSLWVCGASFGIVPRPDPYVLANDRTLKLEKVMDGVVSAVAGHDIAMVIKNDATLWVWGDNYYGAVGNGKKSDSYNAELNYVSVPFKLMDGVKSVSAADDGYSVALKTDGTLWGWGAHDFIKNANERGETLSPVKLKDGVAASAAGGCYGYIAVDAGGTVWECQYGASNGYMDPMGAWVSDKREIGELGRRVMEGVVIPSGSTTNPDPADTPSSWATDHINTALSLGLVPADLQKNYAAPATRAEFCSLAVALYEKFKGEITTLADFTDTSDLNVRKMAGLGVVTGSGDGTFDPGGKITREGSAVLVFKLLEAMGVTLPAAAPTFTDAGSFSWWATERVGQVQAAGIMNGVGENLFDPQGTFTREMSIITMKKLWEYVNR